MTKSKGFKKLPFSWRQSVMKNLKGVNLSVWLYHYWRTDAGNIEVEVSIPEMVEELPYSLDHIKKSRKWLKKHGWLTILTPAQKDAEGKWSIPTYSVSIGGAGNHAVHVRKRKPKGGNHTPGSENNPGVNITPPSGGENPSTENHPRMKKVFSEESAGSPSAVATGEVEKASEVSESSETLASLATGPQGDSQQELFNNFLKEKFDSGEYRNLCDVLEIHTGLKPNRNTAEQILAKHSDFIWSQEAASVVTTVLSARGWKKNIKTPDDFRHYWRSDGETSLWAQVMRNMPDEPYLQGEVDFEPEDVDGIPANSPAARGEAFTMLDEVEEEQARCPECGSLGSCDPECSDPDGIMVGKIRVLPNW